MKIIILVILFLCCTLQGYGQSTFTYQELQRWWGSNTSRTSTVSTSISTIKKANTLLAGDTLSVGQKLTSENGDFFLIMQDDGNLCIYKTADNGFVWGSMIYGFSNAKLYMQTDGNVVIYDGAMTAKWVIGTHVSQDLKYGEERYKPTKLVLENDRIVLYSQTGFKVWDNVTGKYPLN